MAVDHFTRLVSIDYQLCQLGVDRDSPYCIYRQASVHMHIKRLDMLKTILLGGSSHYRI